MSEDRADPKPDWWSENEELRREMDLAEYEPPRFSDGTYTHEIVDELEETYDCRIQFRSDVNPEYPEDWEIRIDHESAARISRHRDKSGNTVYETSPEQFRETVIDHLTEQ